MTYTVRILKERKTLQANRWICFSLTIVFWLEVLRYKQNIGFFRNRAINSLIRVPWATKEIIKSAEFLTISYGVFCSTLVGGTKTRSVQLSPELFKEHFSLCFSSPKILDKLLMYTLQSTVYSSQFTFFFAEKVWE